jgi:flagellar biosynthesis/type III secretory pathway protein FliH
VRKKKSPFLAKVREAVTKIRKDARVRSIGPALIASLIVSVVAFQVGSADGYQTGYSNGNADGFIAGRSEGVSAGRTEGISIGYSQGESAGEKSGYSKGYAAACEYLFDYVDYDADYITAYNPYSTWNRYPSGYYISKLSAC